MDEFHRRYESGRYGDQKKPEPSLISKVRNFLVPGSGEGVKLPQNKSEGDQLKEQQKDQEQ